MNKMEANPKVDAFFSKLKNWQEEMEQLRTIVLSCGLTEELKWGVPCYTLGKSNIVLIHGFKEYCALLFMKGALLQDTKGILVQQTENVQSGRQIRFTNVREIVKLKSVLKAYIYEAIEVEKAGLKVIFKEKTDFKIAEEFQKRLDKSSALKKAFDALTPGRQKGYLLFFSAAKQSKTRDERVEKYIPRILKGKGINDCVCGHSKKMPTCDGSHKYFD
ncbi:YdeI family protein [soil metagenome]